MPCNERHELVYFPGPYRTPPLVPQQYYGDYYAEIQTHILNSLGVPPEIYQGIDIPVKSKKKTNWKKEGF